MLLCAASMIVHGEIELHLTKLTGGVCNKPGAVWLAIIFPLHLFSLLLRGYGHGAHCSIVSIETLVLPRKIKAGSKMCVHWAGMCTGSA